MQVRSFEDAVLAGFQGEGRRQQGLGYLADVDGRTAPPALPVRENVSSQGQPGRGGQAQHQPLGQAELFPVAYEKGWASDRVGEAAGGQTAFHLGLGPQVEASRPVRADTAHQADASLWVGHGQDPDEAEGKVPVHSKEGIITACLGASGPKGDEEQAAGGRQAADASRLVLEVEALLLQVGGRHRKAGPAHENAHPEVAVFRKAKQPSPAHLAGAARHHHVPHHGTMLPQTGGTNMAKAPSTQATRLLKAAGIAFTEHLYRYEEHGGTRVSARELGVGEHVVIKTLVMEDEAGNALIILMHGDREVSTKELARQIGAKTIHPCKPEVANRHSGYLVGGTSPLGTKKAMPVYAEATLFDLDRIYLNGGSRGFLVGLDPRDLDRLLKVTRVNVAIP